MTLKKRDRNLVFYLKRNEKQSVVVRFGKVRGWNSRRNILEEAHTFFALVFLFVSSSPPPPTPRHSYLSLRLSFLCVKLVFRRWSKYSIEAHCFLVCIFSGPSLPPLYPPFKAVWLASFAFLLFLPSVSLVELVFPTWQERSDIKKAKNLWAIPLKGQCHEIFCFRFFS